MPTYRSEHTEGGQLNVYLWIKAGAAQAANDAEGRPFGTNKPMHIIWKGMTTMSIDATTLAGQGFEVHQMPPRTRRADAIAWIQREGKDWANGQPAQLVVIAIKSDDPGNGLVGQ